jgi:spore coat protein U-like protein
MPIRPIKIRHILPMSFMIMMSAANVTYGAPMSCSFVSGNSGAISFPALDLSTAGPVYGTVTTQVQFTCTKNSAYTVTVAPASGWTLQSGPNSIAYTLGVIPSATYAGAAVNLLVPSGATASQIMQANYQDAPAGTYSNGSAITITVDWNGPPGPISATLPINNVSVIVKDACTSAVSGSMSFNIDPSGSGTLTPNTTANGTSPSVKCTKNAVHAIACASAHANSLTIGNDGVTDPIAYTITGCPASVMGSGFSTANQIPIGISIFQTAYQDAQAGAHSDTITVTVTY